MARTKKSHRKVGDVGPAHKIRRIGRGGGGCGGGDGFGRVKLKRSHPPSVAVYARVRDAYVDLLRNKVPVDRDYACHMLHQLEAADDAARTAGAHAPTSDVSSDESDEEEGLERTSELAVPERVRPLAKQVARRTAISVHRLAADGAATSSTSCPPPLRPLPLPPVAAATPTVHCAVPDLMYILAAASRSVNAGDVKPPPAAPALVIAPRVVNRNNNSTVAAAATSEEEDEEEEEFEEGEDEGDEEDEEIIPEGEFIVEEIIGKGLGEDDQVLYHVKWEGYASAENTWEPIENLYNASRHIARFEANHQSI